MSESIDRKIIQLQEGIREAQKGPGINPLLMSDDPDLARALMSRQVLSAVALIVLIPAAYVLKKTLLKS